MIHTLDPLSEGKTVKKNVTKANVTLEVVIAFHCTAQMFLCLNGGVGRSATLHTNLEKYLKIFNKW